MEEVLCGCRCLIPVTHITGTGAWYQYALAQPESAELPGYKKNHWKLESGVQTTLKSTYHTQALLYIPYKQAGRYSRVSMF